MARAGSNPAPSTIFYGEEDRLNLLQIFARHIEYALEAGVFLRDTISNKSRKALS